MRLWLLPLVLVLGCQDDGPAPNCIDKIQNGVESDIDCGGALCPGCAPGKRCQKDSDCRDVRCMGGICQAPTCQDGVLDNSESDIDCGGPNCPPCMEGQGCAGENDCTTYRCQDRICVPPSCDDGVKNGDETGIDCGGSCPPCDMAVAPDLHWVAQVRSCAAPPA